MAVVMTLVPAAAIAQAGDAANEPIEEIVVTGSRLLRRDFTAPSPITTLDRDAIVTSGQPTLEETLNRLPPVQPGFGRASNNPGAANTDPEFYDVFGRAYTLRLTLDY